MKLNTFPALPLSCLIAAVFLLPAGFGRAAEEIDGLAATVNGKVITISEVRQAIAVSIQVEKLGNHSFKSREEMENLIAKIEKEALQDLIDRELILDAFKEHGGVIRPNYVDESMNKFIFERFDGDREAFINELRDTGVTLKTFRKMREEQLIVQYMRSAQTGKISPPTPIEREEWMKKYADRFRGKDYVSLRTITIPKINGEIGSSPETQRMLTEEIRVKIVEGADFSLMAKTYSVDSKTSKGGDWGTIERGDLKKLLSDGAFELEPLTVSEILEDERNYYLLWVDAVQRGDVPPLDEIRDEIDQFVMQEKRKESHDKWIKRLREGANITIFERFTISR